MSRKKSESGAKPSQLPRTVRAKDVLLANTRSRLAYSSSHQTNSTKGSSSSSGSPKVTSPTNPIIMLSV